MITVGLRLISMIVGYVFGTIQTAYFYGKTQGIDIREHGSGNAGTTNTLRVLGPKAGLSVFAGDAGKWRKLLGEDEVAAHQCLRANQFETF